MEGNILKRQALVVAVLFLGLSLLSVLANAENIAPVVKAVVIEGNRKIDSASIGARLATKTGEALSMDSVRDDIRALYGIGYFDNIKVDIEEYDGGVRLHYAVTEKPSIMKVEFAGNKEVSTEKLQEQVSISAGAMADGKLIDDNTAKIVAHYEKEGFWDIEVFPILNLMSKDAAVLTYNIKEGDKIKVREITIEGNSGIETDAIRKVMQTDTAGIFSYFTSSGKYVSRVAREDIDRIKDLYHNNGYITVQVGQPELKISEDRKSMAITIRIIEGNQYSIGKVSVSGAVKMTSSEIEALVKTKPGDIFKRDVLRSDVIAITDYYADKGYAFTDVVPDINVRDKEKLVDLVMMIDEKSLVRVGRVNILGNVSTRDKVIRRELRLDEGDTYIPKLLRRSYQRINNLNFFESVELVPNPKPTDGLMDLAIKVKERPTGSLNMGGGYSSVDGLMATVDVTEGNLFGRGQTLKVSSEVSHKGNSYSVSFTEPWLMDKPLSLTTKIYDTRHEDLSYNKHARGLGLTLGKQISEYVRGSVGYSFERATISNISASASKEILAQEGTRDTSEISASLSRDTRDNYLNPREGSKYAVYTSLAGLGGDNAYTRIVLDTSWHWPMFTESALSFGSRIGYAKGIMGKELPLYERFYVGGMNSVRGHKYGAAGPIDPSDGSKIGGNKELIFNVEYIFPLAAEARLFGVLFFDSGSALNENQSFIGPDLREGVGAGFRWISPIGPLRLEWARNVDPRVGEEVYMWEFTFGTFF